MFPHFLKGRYSLLYAFICCFLAFSFLVRITLFAFTFAHNDIGFSNLIPIIFKGLVFDIGVAVFFSLLYSIYLLVLPQKWVNTRFNRIINYGFLFLMLLIVMFSFFAEFTFWQEFESRFNFIAVDYLIYTYEVVHNINESYPLPLLIGGVFLITLLVMFGLAKLKVFDTSFQSQTRFKKRFLHTGGLFLVAIFYMLFLQNAWADSSNNRYQNELSKAGIYSFFSAFRNNELNYNRFYALIDDDKAFEMIKKELKQEDAQFYPQNFSIKRKISSQNTTQKPNVIMITIESFSAEFMQHFGNKENISPNLDALADSGLLFSNLYATGTRTVRGMEALSLAIPPTPGNSIVRRPDNKNLSTIGSIFRKNAYQTTFFYGGDGYFDNMNQYFSNNGFDIVDRGRKITVGDHYLTKRTFINDDEVSFENAWGICDEDLYRQVIKDADDKFKNQQPFYDFVMTTSNHRPYTYPSGKIDIPSGSGRNGAVKYTDYAIGKFITAIKTKPWFKNTIVIFVADHCASSAGKDEINVDKYHVPCIVYNLEGMQAKVIDKMCSQIDIYPTLFNALGWNYESNFYGQDVMANDYEPRILMGTYQSLAYMRSDSLVVLNPQQKVNTFLYNKENNQQQPAKFTSGLVNDAQAQYQTAYYLFKHGGLRE